MTSVKRQKTGFSYARAIFLRNIAMSTLQWSDSLVLGLPFMDDTHREFVDLLATVVKASDDALMPAWKILIEHTDEHFEREDQWMQNTRFSSSNCHSMQHKVILQVMREGEVRGQAGELDVVRQMARELGVWFPQHAQSMDAALALHLRGVGYDTATGIVHSPQALPQEAIHGCGGVTCSPADTDTDTASAPSVLAA
jgi:hemerythrin-like metal-binding protein